MESESNGSYNFKIVLLGEGAVGKTSLILRYIEDKFNKSHVCTLQASFVTKKINLNGTRLNLSIWDTAGQEKFHALGPIYYRLSNGAILVYDVTDEDSFQKVKNWVRELRKMLGDEICLIIAGNKIDLGYRNVSLQEAEQYAEQVNAKHISVSAKLNKGVQDVFSELSELMLQKAIEQKRHSDNSLNRKGSLRRNVLLVDENAESPEVKQSRCC